MIRTRRPDRSTTTTAERRIWKKSTTSGSGFVSQPILRHRPPWWGSVGATAYVVRRSASAAGPFTDLATVPANGLLTYMDTPPSAIWF